MIEKIKHFFRRQNQNGRLLWVRVFWRCIRNLYEFSPAKRLSNSLYCAYLITVRNYQRLDVRRNIPNGVFHLFVGRKGDEKCVVKVPHLHTEGSWSFYKKLRNRKAFREYSNALLSILDDPVLGTHFPSVKKIRRDGGYRSSYVTGYNLVEIRDSARDGRPLPSEVKVSEIIAAIDELLRRLEKSMNKNGSLCGDWALHNLLYDKEAKRIINVDVEGLYNFRYPALEANLDYIEPVLTHIKAILHMRETQGQEDVSVLKAMSVVAYATESDVAYSGTRYPMGYHSLKLRGRYFKGQRECSQRLADVPYDFNSKVVLDLGCNSGGMLHVLADRILAGVGVDSESRYVNAANIIKSLNGASNLHFFTFDLESEPLSLIDNFILDGHVDICFLLSVCMWLENWRNIIRHTATLSPTLLFESNGEDEQQREQVAFLTACFRKVQLVNSKSVDDMRMKKRALYLCEGARS